MLQSFWAGFEKQAGILTSAGNLIGRAGGRIANRGAQAASLPGKFTESVRQGYATTRGAAAQAAAPAAGARKFMGARPGAPAKKRLTAAEYLKKNPEAAKPVPVAVQPAAETKGFAKKLQGRGRDIVGGGLAGAGGVYLASGSGDSQQMGY